MCTASTIGSEPRNSGKGSALQSVGKCLDFFQTGIFCSVHGAGVAGVAGRNDITLFCFSVWGLPCFMAALSGVDQQ